MLPQEFLIVAQGEKAQFLILVAPQKLKSHVRVAEAAMSDLQLSLPALSTIEVTSVLGNLADMGLLDLGKAKEVQSQRIKLRVNEDDVAAALQDKRLLQTAMARQ